MGRRTLLLISSFLIAAIGTALVGLYVRYADSRASEGAAEVRVVVAKKDIAANTAAPTLTQGATEEKLVRQKDVPPGAFASTDQVRGLEGQVTSGRIPPGVILVQGFFTAASAASLSGVDPGLTLVGVMPEDPCRLPAFLAAGNEVTVFGTPEGADSTTPLFGGRKVKVVAIGALPGTTQPSTTVDPSLITLAVRPADAPTLIHEQTIGTNICLALTSGGAAPSGAAGTAGTGA